MQQLTLRVLKWTSGWGRALHGSGLSKAVAWLAAVAAATAMFYFYYILNRDSQWAQFVIYMIMDCGNSVIGLIMVLLRPIDLLLSPMGEAENQETAAIQEQESNPTNESVGLLSNESSSCFTGVQEPKVFDVGIFVHMIVALLTFTSSVLSDNMVTNHQAHFLPSEMITFFLLDVAEDFFYVMGFFLLAVCYRLIAISLWQIQTEIEEAFPLDSTFVETLTNARVRYEAVFETTEKLNSRTSLLALILISFTTLEMVSSLHQFFSGEDFDWDLETFAILRLLLVLSALLLQVALAAADVMYASERLAEALARSEVELRADQSFQEAGDGGAAICKAFGDRTRNHPARIRFSWFHLTTEWAFGLSLVVFSIVLAVIGIELPGGE